MMANVNPTKYLALLHLLNHARRQVLSPLAGHIYSGEAKLGTLTPDRVRGRLQSSHVDKLSVVSRVEPPSKEEDGSGITFSDNYIALLYCRLLASDKCLFQSQDLNNVDYHYLRNLCTAATIFSLSLG